MIVEVMMIMIQNITNSNSLKYLFSLKILTLIQLTVMTIAVVANAKDVMLNVLEKSAAIVNVSLVLFCSLVIEVVMTFVTEAVMSLVVEAHCVIIGLFSMVKFFLLVVMIALMWIADEERRACLRRAQSEVGRF